MVNSQKSELYFLFFLLGGVFIFTFFIFKPFLYALIMAVVVATLFEPVHKQIATFVKQRTFAALISTILVLCIVVTPLLFLGARVFQEVSNLYISLTQEGGATTVSLFVENAIENITALSPIPLHFSVTIDEYLKEFSGWILPRLGSFFTDALKILGNTLLFLVALYYIFKDGDKLKKYLVAMSPLEDKYDELILTKLSLAVNSVIKGSLVVAIIQGVLTAIGFFFFGIPNATLWGTLASIAALIPALGTGLVLAPGILYLFFTDQLVSAIGLLIWGMTAVGLIDNFLKPKLVGRGMHLHPFLILIAILGGVIFFGPIGFILGPLVMSLLFALLEIYLAIAKAPAR